MIRLLLRLPVLLLLVLGLVWAAILGLSRSPETMIAGGLEKLTAAYPESSAREDLLSDWGSLPTSWGEGLATLGGKASTFGRAGLLVTRLHLGALVRLTPVFLLLVLSGILSGLAFRERMRDFEGYASPTASGIARALVGSGLFSLGLFAGSPLPVSYGWLYLAGVASAFGGALFTANLPLKL